MLAAINLLAAQIEDRERSDAAFHERIAAQEQLVGRMQQQIEELRADQVRSLLKPVLLSLAKLHAEALRSQAFDFDELTADRIAGEFEFFGAQIVDAIEQLGFDSVQAEAGVEFDRTIHAAAKAIDTDDPALDRRIARVARQGFTAAEDPKPLLYAQVDVYRYVEPAEADPPAPLDEPPASESPTTEPSVEGGQTPTDPLVSPEGPHE
jgi:molecular chaperone GrpE (heat shock protein)